MLSQTENVDKFTINQILYHQKYLYLIVLNNYISEKNYMNMHFMFPMVNLKIREMETSKSEGVFPISLKQYEIENCV